MPKRFIDYNKNLKQRSRNLRNNSTLSEVLLWNELKAGKMKGYKFNRQKPMGYYIVDFYCKKLNLVIEVDGESHLNKYKEDKNRQKQLEEMGLHFLRFDNLEVKTKMNNVLRIIETWILDWERKCSDPKEAMYYRGGNPPNPL